MTAHTRLLLVAITVALLAASCGQKGPLTLPEDESSTTAPADQLISGLDGVDSGTRLL